MEKGSHVFFVVFTVIDPSIRFSSQSIPCSFKERVTKGQISRKYLLTASVKTKRSDIMKIHTFLCTWGTGLQRSFRPPNDCPFLPNMQEVTPKISKRACLPLQTIPLSSDLCFHCPMLQQSEKTKIWWQRTFISPILIMVLLKNSFLLLSFRFLVFNLHISARSKQNCPKLAHVCPVTAKPLIQRLNFSELFLAPDTW